MGYFSNGSEGGDYEAQYCERCIHYQGCAVWVVHLVSNYAECNKPDSILHVLIPQDENGRNLQCRMFVQKAAKKTRTKRPNLQIIFQRPAVLK